MEDGKSFIKHKNKIGPNELPCITEQLISISEEKVPLISTICLRSERQLLNQANVDPVIPSLLSFFKSIS